MSSILEMFLLLFVIDAYLYWLHRLMHAVPFLKKIHAVHHADYHYKFHPVEIFLMWGVIWLALASIGYPIYGTVLSVIFSYEVWLTHRKVYKKSNPVHKTLFKSIKRFVTTAKYHKGHHDAPNKNYSQFMLTWDIVMGTRK